MAQGRRAHGGLAPRASRNFPTPSGPGPPRARRPCPSFTVCFPHRMGQGRRARAAAWPLALRVFPHAGSGPGPPRARRPCPSRIACVPTQYGPGPPRAAASPLAPSVFSHAEWPKAAASAADVPLAHGVFPTQDGPGPPRARRPCRVAHCVGPRRTYQGCCARGGPAVARVPPRSKKS